MKSSCITDTPSSNYQSNTTKHETRRSGRRTNVILFLPQHDALSAPLWTRIFHHWTRTNRKTPTTSAWSDHKSVCRWHLISLSLPSRHTDKLAAKRLRGYSISVRKPLGKWISHSPSLTVSLTHKPCRRRLDYNSILQQVCARPIKGEILIESILLAAFRQRTKATCSHGDDQFPDCRATVTSIFQSDKLLRAIHRRSDTVTDFVCKIFH